MWKIKVFLLINKKSEKQSRWVNKTKWTQLDYSVIYYWPHSIFISVNWLSWFKLNTQPDFMSFYLCLKILSIKLMCTILAPEKHNKVWSVGDYIIAASCQGEIESIRNLYKHRKFGSLFQKLISLFARKQTTISQHKLILGLLIFETGLEITEEIVHLFINFSILKATCLSGLMLIFL